MSRLLALRLLLALPALACAIDYTVASAGGSATDGDGETCPDGQSMCGERCVDILEDPAHCGACGNDCGDGVCAAGSCEAACTASCDGVLEVCAGDGCVCRPGLERCGETCVDTAHDPDHCGACGADCGDDPCGGSMCLPGGCAGFDAECDGSCVDFDGDPLHCGECGGRCDSDELCVDGECRAASESACTSCPCDACGAALCCPDLVDGAVLCVVDESCDGEAIDD